MKALLHKQNVSLDMLKSPCEDVQTDAEAQVIIGVLESVLKSYKGEHIIITAPENKILKKVAIIRTDKFSLDLVNPKLIEANGSRICFNESCISFPGVSLNCLRYDSIIVENGFNKELIQLSGYSSFVVQHLLDHLNGVLFVERTIKLALARLNGTIKDTDLCPCMSKKRFMECCQK